MLGKIFIGLLTFIVLACAVIVAFGAGLYLSIYYTAAMGMISLALIGLGLIVLVSLFRKVDPHASRPN